MRRFLQRVNLTLPSIIDHVCNYDNKGLELLTVLWCFCCLFCVRVDYLSSGCRVDERVRLSHLRIPLTTRILRWLKTGSNT